VTWAGGSGLILLGDQARALLTSALRDPLVMTRYRAKMVQVPGSDCLWWRGAVSGRGHGRSHVGTFPVGKDGPVGRDLCVIAHRFGYALVFGAAALNEVPVLGHRCDNPLCQRIGPGHVQVSTHPKTAAPIWRGGPGGQHVGGRPGNPGQVEAVTGPVPGGPGRRRGRSGVAAAVGLQLPLFDCIAASSWRCGSRRLCRPVMDGPPRYDRANGAVSPTAPPSPTRVTSLA